MTPAAELAAREFVLPGCCGTSRVGRELALIVHLGSRGLFFQVYSKVDLRAGQVCLNYIVLFIYSNPFPRSTHQVTSVVGSTVALLPSNFPSQH